ncbi:MAG: hypothetical protein ACK4SX_09340 [Alcanivoracaceae bacterium]
MGNIATLLEYSKPSMLSRQHPVVRRECDCMDKSLHYVFGRLSSCLFSFLAVVLLAGCAGNHLPSPPPHYLTAEGRLLAEQLATDDEAEIHRRWGVYANLVGKQWFAISESKHSNETLYGQAKYIWEIKGSVMKIISHAHVSGGTYLFTNVYQYNPAEGRIDSYRVDSGKINPTNRAVQTIQPDGSSISMAFKPSDRKWVGTTTTWFDRSNNTWVSQSRSSTNVYWEQSDAEYNAMRSQGQKYVLQGDHLRRRTEEINRQLAAKRQRQIEGQAFRAGLYNALVTVNQEMASSSQATSFQVPVSSGGTASHVSNTAAASGSAVDEYWELYIRCAYIDTKTGGGGTEAPTMSGSTVYLSRVGIFRIPGQRPFDGMNVVKQNFATDMRRVIPNATDYHVLCQTSAKTDEGVAGWSPVRPLHKKEEIDIAPRQ